MHAFRDNKASLLIATPAAARGLDLPAVSFVYNTSAPSDATDYLHRAGRAGRIGSGVTGAYIRSQANWLTVGLHG
jgi:superfamily II DNA/RNA helicase